MPITNWVPKLIQQLDSLDNCNIVPSVEKDFDQTSTNLTVFTYEEGVCFSHGHDAHDGGDAAPKGNEALQGVASNVPEGASRPAMQGGGTPPSQAGQVQPVHIIQKVALQKLQQTRVVVDFPFLYFNLFLVLYFFVCELVHINQAVALQRMQQT